MKFTWKLSCDLLHQNFAMASCSGGKCDKIEKISKKSCLLGRVIKVKKIYHDCDYLASCITLKVLATLKVLIYLDTFAEVRG